MVMKGGRYRGAVLTDQAEAEVSEDLFTLVTYINFNSPSIRLTRCMWCKCSKLRVHHSPGVHILSTVCTDLKLVHPVCA